MKWGDASRMNGIAPVDAQTSFTTLTAGITVSVLSMRIIHHLLSS